ncbi:caspase family protein [Streptomyces sp. NPDC005263]|uniref:caspase family protein n=1 Tax=Streptomyces sp. NPDC005263 TaxID=3364711 RepID=UPI0036CF5572
MVEPEDLYRRYLVSAGTAHYDHLDQSEQLRSVEHDVASMASLFCENLGYRRILPELGESPSSGRLRELLSNWLASSERTSSDVLVFYYSGHGSTGLDRRHYLLARDSKPYNLVGTAVATEDLVRMFAGSPVRHALIILDTCYAGAGAEDLVAAMRSISGTRYAQESSGSGLWYIAATRPKEEAVQHAFAQALAQAVADPRNGRVHQPYLDPNALVGSVNERLSLDGRSQRARGSMGDSSGISPLLPNPRHRPAIPAGIDIETQRGLLDREDLIGHWSPRARGVEVEGQAGWYFTGRSRALRELVSWLTSRAQDTRMRIVTGGPGSGKSAVLARLLTLSDPLYRAGMPRDQLPDDGTVPPVGCVDVAIVARDKTLSDIIAAIAADTGLPAAEPAVFVESLLAGERPVTIVLDALDEAIAPKSVARGLLAPLAAAHHPGVRLIVGTRREILRSLGSGHVAIDLDLPEYLEFADLSEYVLKSLLAADAPGTVTPYQEKPRLARQVADAVAARAKPTFLIARIVAHYLASSAEPVDVTRRNWRSQFPATVGDALDEYLERFGDDEQRVRDLLMPLAYASGAGLPWEDLWAPAASAISGMPYTDTDIRWLLGSAGAYIAEGAEDGRSVYRLFHNALAEHMRASTRGLDADHRIARVLVDRVPRSAGLPGPDWRMAHFHTRNHLASYAARAGRLDALMRDPLFLVAAAPDRLVEVLSAVTDDDAVRISRTFQLAAHRMSSGRFAENAALLELAARCDGDLLLADGLGRLPLGQPWRARWARWEHSHHYRLIGRHDGAVWTLAMTEFDGQQIVVSGGEDGLVRRWDLAGGSPLGEPLSGHVGAVLGVASATVEDQPVIVSAGYDGTVRRWELVDGIPLGEPLRGHQGPVRSVAVVTEGGLGVAVSGGEDGTVRQWDLVRGRPLGPPLSGHQGPVHSVAVAKVDGRIVAVSGGADGTVRRWDLTTGTDFGEPLTGHQGAVRAAAITRSEGRPVILSAGHDWSVRQWDLADGSALGEPQTEHNAHVMALHADPDEPGRFVSGSSDTNARLWYADGSPGTSFTHDGSVTSVLLGRVDGRPCLVTGSADSTIRHWEPEAAAAVDAPAACHEGGVSAIACGRAAGRPVALTAGADRTVRRWELTTGEPVGDGAPGHDDWVNEMTSYQSRGRSIVLSAGGDGGVRRWDAESGTLIGEPLLFGEGRWVNTVAAGAVGDVDVVVAGADDGVLRRWSLWTGAEWGDPIVAHTASITTVRTVVVGGTSLIVSASSDRTLRSWSLRDGQPVGAPLTAHGATVWSLATGEWGGRTIVVSGDAAGMVAGWDLTTRARLGEPFRAHDSEVLCVAIGRWGTADCLVTASDDGLVRIWHGWGRLRHSIPTGSGVMAIQPTSTGAVVVGTWRGLLLLAPGDRYASAESDPLM